MLRRLDEAIQADVVIELEGGDSAPGVKGGGVLEHVTREVTVEALPTEIPDRIVANVSAMEINDTLQLSALVVPEGVTLVALDHEQDHPVVAVNPPRREEEEAPAAEAAAGEVPATQQPEPGKGEASS